MTESDTVEELVVVSEQDLPAVRACAAEAGAELVERPNRTIDPVTATTLLIIGGSAAVRTVMAVVEQLKGGQVVDLRPDAPRLLFRTKDLQYGMIVIYHRDGKVQVDLTRSGSGLRGSVQALVSVLSRTAPTGLDDLVKVVRDEVGDDVSVSSATE